METKNPDIYSNQFRRTTFCIRRKFKTGVHDIKTTLSVKAQKNEISYGILKERANIVANILCGTLNGLILQYIRPKE